MKRIGVIAAASALIALAGGWAVYRSAPNAAWLCESDSPVVCENRGTLDLGDFDDELTAVSLWSADVSPTGDDLVVSVNGYEEGDQRSSTGGVALVDAATGTVDRWLVRDVSIFRAQAIAYSPDGSLVGVFVIRKGDGWGQLEIFETATGDPVGSYVRDVAGVDCGRLGFDTSNTLVECDQLVIDIASGEVVDMLDGPSRFGTSSNSGSSWGRDGVWVFRQRDGVIVRTAEVDETVPYEWRRFTESTLVSADPSGSQAVTVRVADDQPWHERWRQRARTNPKSVLTIFDLEQPAVAAEHELGFRVAEGGWTDDGSRLALFGDSSLEYAVLAMR